MDNMMIKCPVTIKAKVTEDLKVHLAAEIEEAIKKTDIELQQIEFHAKRVMAEQAKQDAQGLVSLRQQIESERDKRLEFKNRMVDKLKETQQLEIGAEVTQGTWERFVTVSIGDDLHKLMGTEILLEDGKIIAFRT